jgi:putative restriction endonuclease
VASPFPEVDPDHALRVAAHQRARGLGQRYSDLVPLDVLRQGFVHDGRRISFGSFYKGIHRPKEMRGPAALCLVTAARVPGKRPAYEDQIDIARRAIVYHYRTGDAGRADNRALVAAFEMQVPLIYFHGVGPKQYAVFQPVFVTANDPATKTVLLEVGMPFEDMQGRGIVSPEDVREYAFREVRLRLHQQRFRADVLRAYRERCTICSLREPSLVQAAHIVEDPEPEGIAAVINGLALCAIHHLAYDRNLLGIGPDGVVHIARRLLEERDGPMLREGLQGFHGAHIELPSRANEQPDPQRLQTRFDRFTSIAGAG